MDVKRPWRLKIGMSLLFLLGIAFVHQVYAAEQTNSTQSPDSPAKRGIQSNLHYLVEGVYYLINEKQPDRAVPYLKRAIKLDPNQPDAYYFLGVSHYRMRTSIADALFYLKEAEKRGIQYDRFRPNLLPEIQKRYPDIQSSDSQASSESREVQIIIEGEGGGIVSIEFPDGTIREFSLREPITLAEGERYTIRFTGEPKTQIFRRLVLISSGLAVWALR